MILGSGIQILEGALAKALDEGVTTPTFIEELDVKVCVCELFNEFGILFFLILFINDILKVLRNLVKTAKTVHDQKLDR